MALGLQVSAALAMARAPAAKPPSAGTPPAGKAGIRPFLGLLKFPAHLHGSRAYYASL